MRGWGVRGWGCEELRTKAGWDPGNEAILDKHLIPVHKCHSPSFCLAANSSFLSSAFISMGGEPPSSLPSSLPSSEGGLHKPTQSSLV